MSTYPIRGTHDQATIDQLESYLADAETGALCADGHLGYVAPIGSVAAFVDKISIPGVGYDIACGNCAVLTDMTIDQLYPNREKIADDIQKNISFGVGRANQVKDGIEDHAVFYDPQWEAIPAAHRDRLKQIARAQLGTCGSGNHFVDVFTDEQYRVWVGVHFGSRGLGHNIASGFLRLNAGLNWDDKLPGGEQQSIVNLNTNIGQGYWDAMNLAGEYAYAGRHCVVSKVAREILGAQILDTVHNHHNFAWQEYHNGRNLIVVRKGATPAFPGQKGFVGGSMGDISVILQGKNTPESERLLFSTVHGAGRVMSRMEAKGKINKAGEVKREARVTKDMMATWLNDCDVVLRGGDVDESPHAYRRLPEVLADQGDTIEILHWLKPQIVVMAGDDTFDPYKD